MSQPERHRYDFDLLLARFPGALTGALSDQSAKYHLFHAANSICSQKVRLTLFALNEPFVSHELNMFAGENYDPAYVRARIDGCRDAGLPLSSVHLGATSAKVTGCDACVVPALVDNDSRRVVVDSHRICMLIDAARPADAPSLMPDHLKSAIEAELAIIDMLPNYPLLASALARRHNETGEGNGFARSKVARCEDLIKAHSGDDDLVAAYTAKRDKEQSADARLFTAPALAASHASMKRAFEELDQRLRERSGPLLFGDAPTLADLFWGAELVRAEDLNLGNIWSDGKLPALTEYYSVLTHLPALKQAILDWPGARFSFPKH